MAEPVARDGQELGEILDFMRILWSVEHGLSSMSKSMLRRVDVTGPQRLVLRIVGKRPGINAGELASIMHLHPSTLTGILKRLVERGLLARTSDVADGRKAVFHLTRTGRRVDETKVTTVESVVSSILDDSTDAEIRASRALLSRLGEALIAACVKGA